MDPRHTHAQRRTIRLLKPHRTHLLICVVMAVGSAAASLYQPMVTGTVVGDIVGHRDLLTPVLELVALFVASGALGAAQVYLLGHTGNQVVLGLRHELVRRLLRAPVTAHQATQRGDLFSTAVADTSILGGLLTQSLATLVSGTVMVLGSLGFMAYLDPVLTAVVLGCVAVTAGITTALAGRLRRATLESRDRVGEFGAALQRAVLGIRTVKVSRAEGREEERIGAVAERSFDASMRATRINAGLAPAMGLGVQGSFLAVFTVGAYRMADGGLSTATFSAYLLYLLYLISPLLSMFQGYAQFQQSVASADRVAGIVAAFDDEAGDQTHRDVHDDAEAEAALSFEGVTFGYHHGSDLLRDVSFTLPARGLTAVVGASGTGKSTLFGLIERFWEPTGGTIRLGGRDIRTLSLDELRGRVAYVEQDAAVLDGTLRENLLYANADASEAALEHAVDVAGLADWVRRLPDGLDTPVGESGTSLSGGERQRVVIARMLLTDPEVLLLDEATAHLDPQTEKALLATVHKVAERCAVLAIAHQTSIASEADRVLVVEHGAVRVRTEDPVEAGSAAA